MSRDLQPKYHLRTNFKQKNGIKHREMKKEREREREREKKWLKCCISQRFNVQCSHHTGTIQLIFKANTLTGFYMMRTLNLKE